MDEKTKATVRALLDRHPRGYAAEEADLTVTDSAAGLFRLLCLAILADDSVPSPGVTSAARAMFDRRWISAEEMAKTEPGERADVLRQAGYQQADQAARTLGEATDLVLHRYDGDLQNLRRAAHGNRDRLHALLREIPGMDAAGCAVFLREVQLLWPEAGPFVDDHATRAAERLDLPTDPDRLLHDIARGGKTETLSWLVGALALVDAHNEYPAIRQAAHH
ncbi:MAG TPA: hypothetical protein VHJ17_01335 [Thermomonospora sp.]|nr:hypothetical protein [Thermomonospora sp.]